jgi:two-component system phosphate regulon sensor histidine kinase PhoR
MLMVAHELRAPMGGSQSLLRTLLRGLAGELNEQQQEILARIDTRLSMLTELINDLLSLAATKTVEPERALEQVRLQPVIQQVMDRFCIEAESKQVELTLNAPNKDLVTQATDDGLDKVLSNLIGNAIKYTPSGGSINVTVKEERDHAKIIISDTGIGVPKDDLPKIWDEFYRAQNARRSGIVGTGLGLSIVKHLVTRYGGSIAVHSIEEEGTTFTLTLLLDAHEN